jgi:hypothetical protein
MKTMSSESMERTYIYIFYGIIACLDLSRSFADRNQPTVANQRDRDPVTDLRRQESIMPMIDCEDKKSG